MLQGKTTKTTSKYPSGFEEWCTYFTYLTSQAIAQQAGFRVVLNTDVVIVQLCLEKVVYYSIQPRDDSHTTTKNFTTNGFDPQFILPHPLWILPLSLYRWLSGWFMWWKSAVWFFHTQVLDTHTNSLSQQKWAIICKQIEVQQCSQ